MCRELRASVTYLHELHDTGVVQGGLEQGEELEKRHDDERNKGDDYFGGERHGGYE